MLSDLVDHSHHMQFDHIGQRTTRFLQLIAVGMVHFVLLWQIWLNHTEPTIQRKHGDRRSIIFISYAPPIGIDTKPALKTQAKIQTRQRTQATKLSLMPQPQQNEIQNEELKKEPPVLNRDIQALTRSLEREWTQEERKLQAAKPPNQLVREYWEKQNHPYQDKWDALASKIEKAGVARGPQEESYTLDDGSRITKLNGVCYKAPDPGRTYLNQPEVRRVFCPRN